MLNPSIPCERQADFRLISDVTADFVPTVEKKTEPHLAWGTVLTQSVPPSTQITNLFCNEIPLQIFLCSTIHLIKLSFLSLNYVHLDRDSHVLWAIKNEPSLICAVYSLHTQSVTPITAQAGSESRKNKLKHLLNINATYVYTHFPVNNLFSQCFFPVKDWIGSSRNRL